MRRFGIFLISLLAIISSVGVVAFSVKMYRRFTQPAEGYTDSGGCPGIAENLLSMADPVLNIEDRSYGEVIDTRNDVVRDAILDKIVLTSRESADSPRTLKRKALLLRCPEADGNIVISHGFMCDKFDSIFLRNLFPKKKFNILVFDYRAHGEDRGVQQCTFGRDEIYDLIAAAQFLKQYKETQNKPTYVYGFSMGAATSLLAQSKVPDLFKAMILDCPYDSTESIIKKSIDNLRFSVCGYDFFLPGNGLLKKYAFHPYVQSVIKTLLKSVAKIDSKDINTCIYPVSPSEAAKKITIPCFFIHCKNDDRVPLDAVKHIYNNYGGIKKLWITNGRHHFDSYFYNPEMYTKRVHKFLNVVHNQDLGRRYKRKIIEDKEDCMREDF